MQLPNIYVAVSFETATSQYNLMGFAAHRSNYPAMTDEEIRTKLMEEYTNRFEVEQGHTVRWIDVSFID